MSDKPVALCILDGWGVNPRREGNAIALAQTPNYDRLLATCPNATLTTHGEAVGLPPGSIGNSEVGHLHIGAGRVNRMEVVRINEAIETGEFATRDALHTITQEAGCTTRAVHLIGIISDIGVHGLGAHLIAVAKIFASKGMNVQVHAITDGRDTPPGQAADHIDNIVTHLPSNAAMATVSGRYYPMDRDNRWERVKVAWDTMILGRGERVATVEEAVQKSIRRGETDEFILPTAIGGYTGFRDNDIVFFTNFRADRMRQLATAIAEPDFDRFETLSRPSLGGALSMVSYFTPSQDWITPLFVKPAIVNALGEWIAKHDLTQMRIAETEKFPHVTFFLNGGKEKKEIGECRFMPDSPKVATYDLAPEMSSVQVAERFVEAVKKGFNLIVVNIANPDMVGHTGNLAAATKACEATDRALGRMVAAIAKAGGSMLVIADHGNCEHMIDPETRGVHTAHTTNPVPVVLYGREDIGTIRSGSLIDVAPTLLELLKLPPPKEMTGQSLITDRQDLTVTSAPS